METSFVALFFLASSLFISLAATPPTDADGSYYDYTAYTECRGQPEPALYNGGVLKSSSTPAVADADEAGAIYSSAYVVYNLNQSIHYSFSCWIKVEGANQALITARLSSMDNGGGGRCIGTVLARSNCWSFLKGGFALDSPSSSSLLFFHNADKSKKAALKINVASASLQPFTLDQWSLHQRQSIKKRRQRMVTIHVADAQGSRVVGAAMSVEQIAKDFPFGSAIASTIIGNQAYQSWFTERFNAAVFEDELKWYATEPFAGSLRFDTPDRMLDFVRANRVMVRGHNIFWENEAATPAWVKNLTGADALRSAVRSRIQTLMSRYRGEFAHWDVNNEMLHFRFYEQRLGANASLELFAAAQQADPLATLFMNEYNVVETCEDPSSAVDVYVERLRELRRAGAVELEGIGLEGHFAGRPNPALVRASLDKLATLGLPIWFTEVDISSSFDSGTQAAYLEEVLREAFAHPAVSGVMLWTALHPAGCYQMCLTDWSMKNTPAGDAVDRLLAEWKTGKVEGVSDEHGEMSMEGFLGEYMVRVAMDNRTAETTFSLPPGDETLHLNVHL